MFGYKIFSVHKYKTHYKIKKVQVEGKMTATAGTWVDVSSQCIAFQIRVTGMDSGLLVGLCFSPFIPNPFHELASDLVNFVSIITA